MVGNLDSCPNYVGLLYKIAGLKQRATMAYNPQENGTAERMVQKLTRAIRMYVADVDQKIWDVYAEGWTFAINTAQDCVLEDTPFYRIYDWDPRSTLEATLSLVSANIRYRDPKRWRHNVLRR